MKKEEVSVVHAAPLLCLEKAFMNQNKPPLNDTHSSTHTHKYKAQLPSHTHTQLVLKRLTPKKVNELAHLNIKT